MTRYIKCFDCNRAMSFKVSDTKLLKKYTKIWGRVSSLIDKTIDSKPVYGDRSEYIKTKINSFGHKTNTNFQGKKVPKESSSYKGLFLITVDSVIKANKKYYAEALLEECKYEIKNNRMENNINDDFDSSSSDESDNEPDSEPDSESDNNESKKSFKNSDNESNNDSDNKSND